MKPYSKWWKPLSLILAVTLLVSEFVSCGDTSSGEAVVGSPASQTDPMIWATILIAVTVSISFAVVFAPKESAS